MEILKTTLIIVLSLKSHLVNSSENCKLIVNKYHLI